MESETTLSACRRLVQQHLHETQVMRETLSGLTTNHEGPGSKRFLTHLVTTATSTLTDIKSSLDLVGSRLASIDDGQRQIASLKQQLSSKEIEHTRTLGHQREEHKKAVAEKNEEYNQTLTSKDAEYKEAIMRKTSEYNNALKQRDDLYARANAEAKTKDLAAQELRKSRLCYVLNTLAEHDRVLERNNVVFEQQQQQQQQLAAQEDAEHKKACSTQIKTLETDLAKANAAVKELRADCSKLQKALDEQKSSLPHHCAQSRSAGYRQADEELLQPLRRVNDDLVRSHNAAFQTVARLQNSLPNVRALAKRETLTQVAINQVMPARLHVLAMSHFESKAYAAFENIKELMQSQPTWTESHTEASNTRFEALKTCIETHHETATAHQQSLTDFEAALGVEFASARREERELVHNEQVSPLETQITQLESDLAKLRESVPGTVQNAVGEALKVERAKIDAETAALQAENDTLKQKFINLRTEYKLKLGSRRQEHDEQCAQLSRSHQVDISEVVEYAERLRADLAQTKQILIGKEAELKAAEDDLIRQRTVHTEQIAQPRANVRSSTRMTADTEPAVRAEMMDVTRRALLHDLPRGPLLGGKLSSSMLLDAPSSSKRLPAELELESARKRIRSVPSYHARTPEGISNQGLIIDQGPISVSSREPSNLTDDTGPIRNIIVSQVIKQAASIARNSPSFSYGSQNALGWDEDPSINPHIEDTGTPFMEQFSGSNVVGRETSASNEVISFTEPYDEQQSELRSEPADAADEQADAKKLSAKIAQERADQIWAMMLPAWDITLEEERVIKAWLFSTFARKRALEEVEQAIDKHIVGPVHAPRQYPPPCLVAELIRQNGGKGGKRMVQCPYCRSIRDERICCWAEFAPGVANSFGERIGVRISPTGTTWNRNVQPWTVRLGGKDVRWILRKRKTHRGEPDIIPFMVDGRKI